MYGSFASKVWIWVFIIPAIVLGALAAMGDSVLIAIRLWWIAGPILLVLGYFVWRSLDSPTAEGTDPAAAKKTDREYFFVKLVLTPILVLLCLMVLGVLVALIMWLKPYWLFIGPVYGGFALLVIWTLFKDAMAKRAAAKAAAAPKTDSLVS
jgi:hypothetical protein